MCLEDWIRTFLNGFSVVEGYWRSPRFHDFELYSRRLHNTSDRQNILNFSF